MTQIPALNRGKAQMKNIQTHTHTYALAHTQVHIQKRSTSGIKRTLK
jgi:hypothetical protein